MTAPQPPDADDTLLFAEEPRPESRPTSPSDPWKLLIVDDEEAVHVMTRMVLSDYRFQDRGLSFLSAFSGAEAIRLVSDHPDAACILLDVVMETENAGLDVVQFIRKTQKNETLRIILRTGQPGKAPEKKVILDYDINDYKEKTELTSQKLFTAVTTAIRSHQHLKDLEKKQREIADKNIRLNEEIARRIVAESNLAKYNRSLEGMLEDKKYRLRSALQALKKAEEELGRARRLYPLETLSASAASRMDQPVQTVQANLVLIDCYRQNLTSLLEKYENLLQILNGHVRNLTAHDPENGVDGIRRFRDSIGMKTILTRYPGIINDSRQGIDLISRTLSDMKCFLMMNSDPDTPVSINSLIREILASIQPDLRRRIDLQLDLEELPDVFAKGPALKRALGDLIHAAHAAVARKGIVSISTQPRDGGVSVSVSDTGAGYSAEALEHLFDPCGRTPDEAGERADLFMARTIINHHNGSITAESTRGEGTTLTLFLPTESGDTCPASSADGC
jgi:signal transduction histidine kinase